MRAAGFAATAGKGNRGTPADFKLLIILRRFLVSNDARIPIQDTSLHD